MKVYGPYFRKDGRQHVILYENGKRRTVSYPKFLVETREGITLGPDETIDHIDGNFLNNDSQNLRIIDRSQHAKDDVLRVVDEDILLTCQFCGAEFLFNTKTRSKRTTFCSRSCSGKYGSLIQKGLTERVQPNKVTMRYKTLKGEVAKLVDAPGLSPDAERHEGSNPSFPTTSSEVFQ